MNTYVWLKRTVGAVAISGGMVMPQESTTNDTYPLPGSPAAAVDLVAVYIDGELHLLSQAELEDIDDLQAAEAARRIGGHIPFDDLCDELGLG